MNLHRGDESWYDVWTRKGKAAAGKSSYLPDELLAADGFDGAMAFTGTDARHHIAHLIADSLGIRPGQRVLEVGCGAGATLSLLTATGAALAGADFSAPHIDIARTALHEADLQVAEAAALPWPDAVFDSVFSYGVFLYFQDVVYAGRVLDEMLRVAEPNAPILILDVPDLSRRVECESARRAAGASLNPPHCYYPKRFFESFAQRRGFALSVFDQQVPGYANSQFRFNVLLRPLASHSLYD